MNPAFRSLALLFVFLFCATFPIVLPDTAHARSDQQVRGYVKQNGTYVQPYRRTHKDSTYNNNYSTRGNVNPYHGKAGTKPRDEDYRPRNTRSKSNTYRGF